MPLIPVLEKLTHYGLLSGLKHSVYKLSMDSTGCDLWTIYVYKSTKEYTHRYMDFWLTLWITQAQIPLFGPQN